MSQPLDTSSSGPSGQASTPGGRTQSSHSSGAASDHPDHGKARTLALVSLVLGLLGALTAWSHSVAVVGIVLGIISVPAGLWAQMISTETSQRMIAVLGMTAGGFGLAMGAGHGGLPFV